MDFEFTDYRYMSSEDPESKETQCFTFREEVFCCHHLTREYRLFANSATSACIFGRVHFGIVVAEVVEASNGLDQYTEV